MTSTPLLQCLFCEHFNPLDASFCNSCGSPLNLQPCGQCEAINERSAINCYKCGAEFTLPASPESDSADPPSPDQPLADATLNETGTADAHPFLPRSEVPSLETLSQRLQYASAETPADGKSVSVQETTAGRPMGRLAVSALVILAMAFSAYYLYQRPSNFEEKAGEKYSAQSLPNDQNSARLPTVMKQKVGFESEGFEKPLALSPSANGAPRSNGPSLASDANSNPRQDPPIIKECPETVATLGLCTPTK